jgi:serine phosphatase RsbU (regulator of sigma subunit)
MKTLIKIGVIAIICFSLISDSFGQGKIDSLNREFSLAKADTVKCKILVELFKQKMYVNIDSAILYAEKGLKIAQNGGNKLYTAQMYNLLGTGYLIGEKYPKALENFLIALRMSKELNNIKTSGAISMNIGTIYLRIDNQPEALKYYLIAYNNFETVKDSGFMAQSTYNLASLYFTQEKYEEALKFALKSEPGLLKLKADYNLAFLYSTIAACYVRLNNEELALKFAEKGIYYSQLSGNKYGFSLALNVKAVNNYDKKNYKETVKYATLSLNVAQEIKNWQFIRDASLNLYLSYKELNDYKNALTNHELYLESLDSIFNSEKNKEINGLQLSFEREQNKKDKIISEEKASKQKIILLSISIITGLLVFIITYVYRRLRLTRRQKLIIENQNIILIQKNEEISAQSDEIAAQRDNLQNLNSELSEKNEEITAQNDTIKKQNNNIKSSITYASRIQNAIIPSITDLELVFPNHFILFKPSDIVSGDFYWVKKIDNFIYIVAADCTGHGVPGAFMSVLGITLLTELINKHNDDTPNIILNEFRNRIKKSLNQIGQIGEQQDGLDIAFCKINLDNNVLQFSGAYNPLYLVRNDELIEYKADRMPIGIHPKDQEDFTNTEIQLQKGDNFYIFSDGYTSQFGGEKNNTFKNSRLKEILVKDNNKPMKEQKEILNQKLNEWRGDLSQTDDILVIGINID